MKVLLALTLGLASSGGLGKGFLATTVNWSTLQPGEQVQIEKSVDDRPYREVVVPPDSNSNLNLRLPVGVRHRLRVRSVSPEGRASDWSEIPFRLKLERESSESVAWTGRWSREPWKGWLNWGSADQFIRVTDSQGGAGVSFSGTSIQWIADRSPEMGVADVVLDGQARGAVDLFAPSVRYGESVFTAVGLDPSIPHRLEVRARPGSRINVHSFGVLAPF